MLLNEAAADNRRRLAEQLYHEWRGYYMLQVISRDLFGWPLDYVDVRPLSFDEAVTFRCGTDEALRIVW